MVFILKNMVVVATVVAIVIGSCMFFCEMGQELIVSNNGDAFELVGGYFENLLSAVGGGHVFFVCVWGSILAFFQKMCKFCLCCLVLMCLHRMEVVCCG